MQILRQAGSQCRADPIDRIVASRQDIFYAVVGVFLPPVTDPWSIAMMKKKNLQSLPKDCQLLYDKREQMNICILPPGYRYRL
jgi:hypothetical protein